ncbi:MAG: hypothetical protein ABI702_04825 [Burkholderiales bacterium]
MRSLFAAASLVTIATSSHAAGGHFDVDDATVLDAGRCQVELWAARVPAASTTLVHVGSSCRAGPVEIGANLERIAAPGDGRTLLGPQFKWVVDPLVDKVSVGVAWSAAFDQTNRGRPAQTLYAPLTWRAAEKMWVHVNVGVDRDAGGNRWRREGVSGEWAASDKLSVIAERVKLLGGWTSRIGGRLNVGDALSIDLSVARTGSRAERVFVVGLSQEFAR